MVIGVGVDIVEVARIRRILEDPGIGPRFRERIFTEREIEYCENKRRGKYKSYAGRFTAKEAVMKALGQGWGPKVTWLDIETLSDPGGKPEVYLHGKTSAFAHGLGIRRLSLSITHTEEYAMACVIAQDD